MDAPAPLDAAYVAQLAQHGTTRRYPARAVVVTEGDESDSLFILVEGRARAYVSDGSGREVVLSVMGPGEYFGELAIDDNPRSASVVTLEPCVMVLVPRSELDAFLVANPPFAAHFIRRLIGRIRVLTNNVRSLALMDAYGRVARLLLESSITEGGEQFIPERLTQVDIASRVGCSREMVSRIFKDLVQGGYIEMQPRRILIRRKPPARW